MDRYKSWSGLNKQLRSYLCDELRDRVCYFLTRYHEVHNAYGRASVCLDKKEWIIFSWIEMYHQEQAVSELYAKGVSYDEACERLKPLWDEAGTYYEMDFLEAALQYRNMNIQEALYSDNYIIRIFAIMDKRAGRRTLTRIEKDRDYEICPEWVQQFYRLRFSVSLPGYRGRILSNDAK